MSPTSFAGSLPNQMSTPKRSLLDLGFVFKVSLYSLTALIGAILGSAESEGVSYGGGRFALALPFLSITIVLFGYMYTERRRVDGDSIGTGLSSAWANILGMISLCATAYEFTREGHEGKLLAGTHLLLYATWIVLFQQKTVRLYWFLMALGILQLAVASVLTTRGWFGFCALGYMFSAVWTLSIFSLWRAEQQFEEDDQQRYVDAVREDDLDRRAESNVTSRLASEVRGSVQHEDGTQWLTGRFVTGVLLTSFSALLVSAAFFVFVPRVWVGASVSLSDDSETLTGLGKKTGLSSSVRLGGLGPILESMDRVFEIQLKYVGSGQLISAQEYAERLGLAEPLFRASVMTLYEDGRWGTDSMNSLLTRPFHRQFKKLEIEQIVRLDPNESGVLFCMGQPLIMVDPQHNAFGEYSDMTGVASQGERRKESGMLVYSAFSSLPGELPLHHKQFVSPMAEEAYHRGGYFDRTTKLPNNLKKLKELAQEVVRKEVERRRKVESRADIRKLTPLEIAMAMEAFLRDSGEYRYSLDQSIMDPKIDPIEDFLLNRKEGHCEYFATALALLLRAQKIPSRIVSGYKGGMVRPDKKDWLEVQQRFAHVWVEAWLDKQGWTTLDATPADERSLSISSVAAKKPSLWTDVQSTLAGLWSDNVLNMSLDRQEESIYRPIRELAFASLRFFRKLFTSPASALRSFIEFFSNRERLFSVGGGLVAFTAMLFVVGLISITRWLIKRFRNWVSSEANRRIHDRYRIVEFYERFCRLMQSHGLSRIPTQTQQEFAEMVTSAYTPELAAIGLAETPKQIANLFYKVRFGEHDLSEGEAKDMEDLLTKLESILTNEST